MNLGFEIVSESLLYSALYDPEGRYWLGVLFKFDQATSADGVPLVIARFLGEEGISCTVMSLEEFRNLEFTNGEMVSRLVYKGVKKCRARVAHLALHGRDLPAHEEIEGAFLAQALVVAEKLGIEA